MHIALFCSGFTEESIRLQPWLTMIQVARLLAASDHAITLVTDGQPGRLPFPTQVFNSLRGSNNAAIRSWLDTAKPDRAIIAVTPFSLVTGRWHRGIGRSRAWAYLAYGLYTPHELWIAWPYLSRWERWAYCRNLLVPAILWRKQLEECFKGVICQSQRTGSRIGSSDFVKIIPPGIDLGFWTFSPASSKNNCSFLYLGGAIPIRGYEILLAAMQLLPPYITLRMLARGLDAEDQTQLETKLAVRGLQERVFIRGGWLPREELRAEIQAVIAVVMPFVLVPSELPVSVLEVIAAGTPVIVSDIDGLPESVGDAGLVVPPGNVTALANAMQSLADDPIRVAALRKNCLMKRSDFADWNAVGRTWSQLLQCEGT